MDILANSSYEAVQEISYSDFYKILEEKPTEIQKVIISGTRLLGEFRDGSRFYVDIPSGDMKLVRLLQDKGVNIEIRPPENRLIQLLFYILPSLLFLGPFILFILLVILKKVRGVVIFVGIMNIIAGVLGVFLFLGRAPIIILSAPLLIITGIGLLRFKEWARISEIIITILGVLLSAILFWHFALCEELAIKEIWLSFIRRHIISWIAAGIIIYCFTHPKIKEQFKR